MWQDYTSAACNENSSIFPVPGDNSEFVAHPDRQRSHQAMDDINKRYGAMTLASARLLDRSSMPDVISPAWKPEGHRKSL